MRAVSEKLRGKFCVMKFVAVSKLNVRPFILGYSLLLTCLIKNIYQKKACSFTVDTAVGEIICSAVCSDLRFLLMISIEGFEILYKSAKYQKTPRLP